MQQKKVPLRQCLGCQEMKPKKDLIRILKTPEDEYLIDATGKKNGRGAYICRSYQCLENAINKKGIDRSFKTAIPKEVYDKLREEMKNIGE